MAWAYKTLRRLSTARAQEVILLYRNEEAPHLPVKSAIDIASKCLSAKAHIDETKPPLVMIHGLFGSKANFSSTARGISAQSGIETIGVDMRNHGSSQHAMPHDYTSMANDTIQYLDKLGKKVFLAGHLMGAKVSMIVALKRPELVEKLIVIDNAPSHDLLDKQFTLDLMGMYAAEKAVSGAKGDKYQIQKKVDSVLAEFEPDPLVRLFLESNLKHSTHSLHFRVPVLNFLKEGVVTGMELWPELQGLKYNGPVLIVRGTRSPFVLDEHLARAFPRYFSDFRSVDFDSGHWVVSEKPHDFVRETLKFLENRS